MKSLLPIIFIILVLTGAITYSLAKKAIPKRDENTFGIAANQREDGSVDNKDGSKKSLFGFNEPTATPTVTPSVTPSPTKGVTTLPNITEDGSVTTKGGEKIVSIDQSKPKVTKITKTIVCTPVYGQANTCTEHIVVDTGAADSIFFNFAGLSYLAGLASFIKAKSLKI